MILTFDIISFIIQIMIFVIMFGRELYNNQFRKD